MIRTVIIGSGNVAYALGVALTGAGNPPVQIFARNRKAAGELAGLCGCVHTGDPSMLAAADLYIIAVSDKAIAPVSASLDFGDGVVVHTAGSVPMDALSHKIKNRGVLYPLQTFSSGRKVDLREVPVLTEASTPHAMDVVGEIARLLSGNVTEVDSARRLKVHMAAVFACNFTNYMYIVGEGLVMEADMDFSLLKPLIAETAAKALDARSPRLTQTGPAARNDFQTKSLHCEMLREKPALKSLYTNLSNSIWEISKKTSQK